MMRYACVFAVAVVFFLDIQPGWSQQQYLYSPTAVVPETKAPGRDDILVQDVSVRKGDSLYKISRKFSGRGSYYPQILLFNDIKNPNRIYPGNVFKVPVARKALSRQVVAVPVENEKAGELRGGIKDAPVADVSAQKQESGTSVGAAVAEVSPQDLKKSTHSRVTKKRGSREKIVGSVKKQVTVEKQAAAGAGTATAAAGQKLFERAVKAYRQDDCRAALELFEKFLTENQGSPLAADASLYKADCYLKLSTQN